MRDKIFEEIKQRYEKSNKYMLCLTYEDIGILIHIIEVLDKQLKEYKDGYNSVGKIVLQSLLEEEE